MKKASIVIPTKDKLSRLRLVLKALENQVDETVEVLVIFDGCAGEVIREFEKVTLKYKPVSIIHPQNLGRAKARNSGIREARGEVIIFLDDDRLPAPDFVYRHIRKHEMGRYAVIGERYNVDYPETELTRLYINGITAMDFKQIKHDAVRETYDILKKIGRRILGQLLEAVTFTTGNSSVRRQDLFEAGLFDENYTGWGVEDIDLGYRLVKDGVKVVRDYKIVNYHLIHPVNKARQKEEYYQNLNYFISKIHQDQAAVFMIKLLNIIM